MGSPLRAGNYISVLKGAASLKRLGTTALGNPYKIRGLSAITWGPETSGSRSRPL